MSSSFKIIEHKSPCQTIREYPQGTSTYQEDTLYLSAKQYIPLNREPQPGDVTILAAHASAFPKELYEPLWEDLLKESEKAGYGIRSIWMADAAHQGASYVLNEEKTGIDPNYIDHARDLLCLVNTFRDSFTRPIIGIGHSMGACSIFFLSMLHPRLLTSTIYLDAIFPRPEQPMPTLFPMARLPSFRKDVWPSRSAASAQFRKNGMVKKFDTRVIDKIVAHSVRDMPTLLYPEVPKQGQEIPVTLTTPKHQEAVSIARPNYQDVHVSQQADAIEQSKYPDIWPDTTYKSPFYKSEGKTCFMLLPFLRPSAFFLNGSEYHCSDPEEVRIKTERTGTGFNGSGGVRVGKVKAGVVQGGSHFFPFEKVQGTAEALSAYLDDELGEWRNAEEKLVCREWKKRDLKGKQMLDGMWLKEIKTWNGQREVLRSKL